MNLAAWQTAECDGRRRTIRRAFGLRLVNKRRSILRTRLFGKAALQTLKPQDEIGFRDSVPPRLLHPHRGHGPQRKLERLVYPKSMQGRVGSQLAVAADGTDPPPPPSPPNPPVLWTGRHQAGAEHPPVIAPFTGWFAPYALLDEHVHLLDIAQRPRQLQESGVLGRGLPEALHDAVRAKAPPAWLDLAENHVSASADVDGVAQDRADLGEIAHTLDLDVSRPRQHVLGFVDPQQNGRHPDRVVREGQIGHRKA